MKVLREWKAEKLCESDCKLGESPLWNAETRELYWVDILGHEVHWFNTKTNEHQKIMRPRYPSAIVLDQKGNLIVATQVGIYHIALEDKEQTCIGKVELDETIKFNDGKISPKGDLWIGTMAIKQGIASSKNKGALYNINQEMQLETKISDVTISNGLCWDEKNGKFYYIDTPTHQVYQYTYNGVTGEISNPKVCIEVSTYDGLPDGMTIDEKGRLWIAHWGGSAVYCYNPNTGEKEEMISVPTQYVTSVTFGGEDMQTLFITTAKQDDPRGGHIYQVHLDVKGIPTYRYR